MDCSHKTHHVSPEHAVNTHDTTRVSSRLQSFPSACAVSKVRDRNVHQPRERPLPFRVLQHRAGGMSHTAGVVSTGGGWSRREERHGAGATSSSGASSQPHGGATPSGRTADTGAVSDDSHHEGTAGRGSHKGAPCVKCGTRPGACEAVAHACFTLRFAKAARSGEAGERVVQELVQAGHRCGPGPRCCSCYAEVDAASATTFALTPHSRVPANPDRHSKCGPS